MHRNKLNLIVDVLAFAAIACLAATGTIMYYRLPPGSHDLSILGYTRHEWGTFHFYVALTLIALMVLHVVLHWKWVTNTFGALVRRKEAQKAGAGVGGAVLLVVLGLAAAGALAAPWLLPLGTGAGRGEREGAGGGKGKGYRGGRAEADESPATPSAAGEAKQGASSVCETCDGTCPSEAAELAARHAKGQGQQKGGGEAAGADGVKGSMTLAEAAAEAGVPVARILAELKLPAATAADETLGRLRRQHGFTMEDVRGLVARFKQEKQGKP